MDEDKDQECSCGRRMVHTTQKRRVKGKIKIVDVYGCPKCSAPKEEGEGD